MIFSCYLEVDQVYKLCLSDTSHLKATLNSRYVGFCKSLLRSPKYIVRLLATLSITDLRTKLGETNHRILSECGLKNTSLIDIQPKMIKRKTKYMDVPIEENWRVGILQELINTQNCVAGFTEEEMQEILQNVCST